MILRRDFLGWVTVAPVLGFAAPARSSTDVLPRNSVIVLDDVGSNTNARHLQDVLQGLATRGLPVTCIVDCAYTEAGRLDSAHPVAAVLRDFCTAVPGLVELCPYVHALAVLTPYFQARATYEAQVMLSKCVWGEDRGAKVPQSRIVACADLGGASAPSGVRASGVRTVLVRPPASAPVRSESWDAGVLRLFGGVRLGSSRSGADIESETLTEKIYYLSMSALGRDPKRQIVVAIDDLYEMVRPQLANGWLGPTLAADLQFRDAYDYRRYVSFHFFTDAVSKAATRETLDTFRTRLASRGFATTIGPALNSSADGMFDSYWVSASGRSEKPLSEAPLSNLPETGSVIAIALWRNDAIGCAGLDAANVLRLPTLLIQNSDTLKSTAEESLGVDDLVIAVSADLLTTQRHQRLLETMLIKLQNDGFTSVVDVRGLVQAVAPQGPYLTHHRRTETYRRATPTVQTGPQGPSIDRHLADAKIAWAYFETWTNPKTGLCPATVNIGRGGAILHEAVTMWDVGSHINALIAAYELEIITKTACRRAIMKILPNLRGRKSQGRLLPQGWIVTDRVKWGVKDFDGCDAGRLLAALYNLDRVGVAGQVGAPLVFSWDLKDVVIDGIIHSVKDGELLSTYQSHCAHYAAWTFRTWGIECVSPYETFLSRASTDGEMALLEAAAQIGPIGAEPLLLEALELGMSAESSFLADVLFAAQVEEYQETGDLICVSESPIDREPWFIYSGLLLNAPGRRWATDTVESLPEHRTTEFAAKNLTVSSKAAYLWSAYAPHEYSNILVNFVRDKARTSSGFRSSIYQRSGEATQNMDLNTNAVILQSVAEILRKA